MSVHQKENVLVIAFCCLIGFDARKYLIEDVPIVSDGRLDGLLCNDLAHDLGRALGHWTFERQANLLSQSLAFLSIQPVALFVISDKRINDHRRFCATWPKE